MVYAERKVAAFMQQRYGPWLVGPKGLLQPIADIVKLIFKEELQPEGGRRGCCSRWRRSSRWPPASSPSRRCRSARRRRFFGWLDEPMPLLVADLNVGVLVVFAVASMGVYGIVLAGWASNSKYSLLGGLRSSAQMISYELAYGMALATVVLLAGVDVVPRDRRRRRPATTSGFIPRWNVFVMFPFGLIAFLLFFTAGVAETNRAPFDFPEAEQELVAGYHTEYSSMRFAMFFMAEYINMVTVSAVAVNLFLGGWHGPLPAAGLRLDLVPDQAGGAALHLPVAALDAAALPLRPADDVRLEGAAAGGHRQPAGDGGGGDLLWALISCSSTCSPPSPCGGALLVVGQRNPIYSVVAIVGAFFGLSGLYVLLEAPFVAVVQIIIYAGAILVLFLFTVMLLNASREDAAEWDRTHPLLPAGADRVGAVLARGAAGQLVWAFSRIDGHRRRRRREPAGGVERRGCSAGCSSPTTCSPSK